MIEGLKRPWIVLIIGTCASLLLFFTAYNYSRQSLFDAYEQQVRLEHEAILDKIHDLHTDKQAYLQMLTGHPDVIGYLGHPDAPHRERLEDFFYRETLGTPSIMQLRLLDASGRERIRVDRHEQHVFKVAKTELQDKSRRDYFRQFRKLAPGSLGFSRLDLNVENGAVEIPFKPTLRVAMPVYRDDALQGIVIINYSMAQWLRNLQHMPTINVYLVDPEGHFVLHPDNAMSWSAYRVPAIPASSALGVPLQPFPENAFTRVDDFFANRVALWNGEEYLLLYEPKVSIESSVFEQTTFIGILLLSGLVILILPFGKLLLEYIRNLRRAQSTLAMNEARLQAIFDNTFDAIIIINDRGIIRSVNRAAVETFGYLENELVGQNINILIPEPHHDLHDGYIRSHDKAVTSKIIGQERELFGRHREGTLIPVSLGVTQMEIDGELYFIGTIRDISHEKQTAKLFEQVFSLAPLGIALVTQEGKFWRLNRRFCDIVGYNEEELRALTFQEITHPDDLAADLRYVEQVASGKLETYSMEKRYYHKEGHIVWINLTVSAIFADEARQRLEYFIAMIEDITERKTIIEELSRTKERLVEAETVAQIGHWDWDIPNDSLYWSDSMVQLFGGTTRPVQNNYDRFLGFVHPDDREPLKRQVEATLRDQAPLDMTYRIVLDDGTEKIIHAKASVSREDGEPIRLFGTCQDVTQIKTLEAREKEQERMLMQQSKLVAMGEMVGAIAHQWRQPLNTIGLSVQDLLSAYRYGELDEEYLKNSQSEMMHQLKYMSQTIDEFRNFFAKSRAVDRFNLLDAAGDVVKLYWAQLKAHDIILHLECPDSGGEMVSCSDLSDDVRSRFEFVGAVSEFKQVLLNCLSNAKDAILQLEAPDTRERTVIMMFEATDTFLRISIRDLAGGMDDATRERIFEPYFTTREMGTGLGLYIVRMITERILHGGIECRDNRLETEERNYRGSAFVLTLPFTEETPGEPVS